MSILNDCLENDITDIIQSDNNNIFKAFIREYNLANDKDIISNIPLFINDDYILVKTYMYKCYVFRMIPHSEWYFNSIYNQIVLINDHNITWGSIKKHYGIN